ncbi:MAG: DNA-binding protein [Chlorobaculum sp.]|nr:DNA-binding protein [Chlorobaculum sp.]
MQTRSVSPDDRLMAAIRIIVRQELATVLTSAEPKDRLLTVAGLRPFCGLPCPPFTASSSATRFTAIKKTKRLYFSERKLIEWLEKGRMTARRPSNRLSIPGSPFVNPAGID